MHGLVEHLVKPIVANPDDVSVKIIEGDATVVLELLVHEDDKAIFEDEDGRNMRAISNVISAAAGRRKASLELVDEHSDDATEPEEAAADESDDSDADDSEAAAEDDSAE